MSTLVEFLPSTRRDLAARDLESMRGSFNPKRGQQHWRREENGRAPDEC